MSRPQSRALEDVSEDDSNGAEVALKQAKSHSSARPTSYASLGPAPESDSNLQMGRPQLLARHPYAAAASLAAQRRTRHVRGATDVRHSSLGRAAAFTSFVKSPVACPSTSEVKMLPESSLSAQKHPSTQPVDSSLADSVGEVILNKEMIIQNKFGGSTTPTAEIPSLQDHNFSREISGYASASMNLTHSHHVPITSDSRHQIQSSPHMQSSHESMKSASSGISQQASQPNTAFATAITRGRDLPFNQASLPSSSRRLSVLTPVKTVSVRRHQSQLGKLASQKENVGSISSASKIYGPSEHVPDLEGGIDPGTAWDKHWSQGFFPGAADVCVNYSEGRDLSKTDIKPVDSRRGKNSSNIILRLVSLAQLNLDDELIGIVNPSTLSFYDEGDEESYNKYYMRFFMPLWRQGLVLELGLATAHFIYTMKLYPEEASQYLASISQTAPIPSKSCGSDQLCNSYNSSAEILFYVFGLLIPNVALYMLSFKFTLSGKLVQYVHSMATSHMLILCLIMISLRHFVIEPTTTPYVTLALHMIALFGCTILLRIRFLHILMSSPFFLLAFMADTLGSYYQYGVNSLISVVVCIMFEFATLLIISIGSYDYERSIRAQFLKSRTYISKTEKLIDQLKDLGRNYADRIADFDSPLEKAITMVKRIRTDSDLRKDHFDSLGIVLALLNSSDLMTPDIGKQVEGGQVSLDEEGEAWLLSNLYRNGRRGGSKANGLGRKSTAMFSAVETNLQVTDADKQETQINRPLSVSAEGSDGSAITSGRKESIASLAVTSFYQHFSQQDHLGRFKITIAETMEDQVSPVHARSGTVTSGKQLRKLSERSTSFAANPASYLMAAAPPIVSETHLPVAPADIACADTSKTTSKSSVSRSSDLSATGVTFFASILPAEGPSNASSRRSSMIGRSRSMNAIATYGEKKYLTASLRQSLNLHQKQPPTAMRSDFVLTSTNEESLTGSEESFSAFNKQLKVISLLDRVSHWNWELFDLAKVTNMNPLITLSHYLFVKEDLFTKFRLPKKTFLTFCDQIERGYHKDVPYHNSLHATDVLHGVAWMKDRCLGGGFVPTDLEILALFLAAIPGRNNNFLVNTSDAKALMYNDRSVLENHHLSAAFKVLLSPECNFLLHLAREDYKQIREIVVELVLATDLQTHHFLIMSMFKNKVSLTSTFDPCSNGDDRNLLFKMMIKCADVSNPTKAWPIYEQWTARVLEEFFQQGDAERSFGIPVSPYYDRETISVPASQLGFIDFICLPLFEAFDLYATVPCVLEGLYANRSYWIKQKEDSHDQGGGNTGSHKNAEGDIKSSMLINDTPQDIALALKSSSARHGGAGGGATGARPPSAVIGGAGLRPHSLIINRAGTSVGVGGISAGDPSAVDV